MPHPPPPPLRCHPAPRPVRRPFLPRRAAALAAVLLLAAVVCAPRSGHAQRVSKVGTSAAAFLEIGVGPRATAMGGAYAAAADDVLALYWNPAGLARMGASEAFVVHSEWVGDVTFDYVGVALEAGGRGTVGLAVTMLGVPEMEVRTEVRQEGTGERFDAADLAVALSYSRAVTDRFTLGGTAKFIQQRIWHARATGFAVDLGTQFRTDFFGGLTIGAVLYNFGTDLTMRGRDLGTFVDPDPGAEGGNDRIPADLSTDAWSLPLNFQIGLSARPLDTRMHQLMVSADAVHPSSNYESVNVGAEYGFMNRFFLRGGFHALFLADREGGVSGGMAVHQPLPYTDGTAKLDYGYQAFGRLGGTHAVSLGVTF